MQIQEAAALAWLSDEVKATLTALDRKLGEQPLALDAIRADIDSFAAAFDLAGCDALCRYSQLLVAVVDSWRAEQGSVRLDLLTQFRTACHHLHHYLSLKQRDADFCELALYVDYRWLCDITHQAAHPIQLWPLNQKNIANRHLSEDTFVHDLQTSAKARLQHISPDQLANIEVESALLAFIRYRDRQASTILRTVCDLRATQASQRPVQLFGHLLGLLIAVVEQQKLEFDALLKRILLQSLAWLKGQNDDTSELDTLIFYIFVAWQNSQAVAASHAQNAWVESELAHYAQQTQWMPCKGVNYNRMYFSRYSQEGLAQLHAMVMQSQQLWAQVCIQDASNRADKWTGEVAPLMAHLNDALIQIFAPARDFSQELQAILAEFTSRSVKEVQIEVAAMLLVLGGLILETHGAEDVLLEERLSEMARRLRSTRLGQPAGAYAPWMLAQQRQQTQAQASQILVEVIQAALGEAESGLAAYWQSNAMEDWARANAALERIQGAAYSLQFEPFDVAVTRAIQDVQALRTAGAAARAGLQHEMTHSLASLSLLLDMYAQGTAETDAALSFSSLQAPQLVLDPEEPFDDVPVSRLFLQEFVHLQEQGCQQLQQLELDQNDEASLIDLRRTFHTMKGGAKTAGLARLADMAWQLEQCLNACLAEKYRPTGPLLVVIQRTLDQMKGWHAQLSSATAPEQVDANLPYGAGQLERELLALNPPPNPVMALPTTWLDLPDAVVQEAPQVKTIGHIELSISLFNAYLNEADEWSRQLAFALTEWAVDDQTSLPPQTLTWAHALVGSSATVQFTDLATVAKALERLIERVIEHNWRPEGLATVLAQAGEEIRRLLHQFAAGFLKAHDDQLLVSLTSFLDVPLLPLTPLNALASAATVPAVDSEISAIFAEEAQTITMDLGRVVRVWQSEQSDRASIEEVLRLLHTLKGSARLAQRQDVAQIAHQLESDLESASVPLTPLILDRISQAVDSLVLLLLPASDPLVASEPIALAPPALVPVQGPLHLVPAGETIRVKSSIIDRLVNQTGELMIGRSRMESEATRATHTLVDLGVQGQRLRDQLRELELQTEMQMQSRQAKLSDQASSFDPLELDRFTRAQELTRFMAEAVSDITTLQRTLQQSLNATEDLLAAQRRQTIDMQRYLLSTRMVEFNSISERLMRLVRLTSQEVGIPAELKIENGSLEMDRVVIERMLPAFEHLLRNAIVHGLEPASERLANGKLATGAISILLEQTGKDVRITLQDDGRGIDTQAVLAKAQTMYEQMPSKMPTQEPLQLIFASGLSTASQVTELAGRGVGMDVVRAQVQALGGQIDVASQAGQGTSFHLILPLTMAVTQIVLVRTASLITAIPVNLVLTTLRLKPDTVTQASADGYLAYGQTQIPFHRLAPLIQSPSEDGRALSANIPVIILQSAGQTIALQVDEVLGSQEAVVKNLGQQLSQLPALTGMTVLPSGQIALIYNPVALATVYGERVAAQQARLTTMPADGGSVPAQPKSVPALAPLVLIVDDSITMRRVLQRLLEREAYRVMLAADGKQALAMMSTEKPVLVLSDVEMPRMDGFALLQHIRSSEQLQNVPVVMITSRMADKHRQHATELGANAYLGKPYPEAELLELIKRFAGKANA